MSAPDGYRKLPSGVRCRCLRLWREGDDFYCCNATWPAVEDTKKPDAAKVVEKRADWRNPIDDR